MNIRLHADPILRRSRERAIKDLLARSGHKLNEWTTRGLVGSLKLPMAWIDEAKVGIISLYRYLY